MKAIKHLLERIETARAPFWRWCAAFLGILFVRFLIETFTSPTPSFPASPATASLVHYFLFFLGSFITLALVIRIFVPDIARISKFLLFGFPIIWLSPILDLIYSHGAGALMTYVFASNPGELFYAFFHIGSLGMLGGLTAGLRVEIMAIFIGVALYVWIKTGNAGKAILSGFLGYIALFFWGIIPVLVAFVSAGYSFPSTGISAYVTSLFLSSHLLVNFARPSASLSPLLAIETSFNLGMSTILYFVDFLLVVLWTAVYRKDLLKAFARSFRIGRIAYYYSLFAMGAFVAMQIAPVTPFANWMDILSFACLALAYLSAFAFATGVNDIADIDIDRANGAVRPLVINMVDREEVEHSDLFFLAWALIGGYLCGYWALFTVIAATAAYYIYSAPPLRLKRAPIISSFLVAVAGLSTTMAGFFFIDGGKVIADFPPPLLLLILVCLTFATNAKDVKDIAGDRAHDIWTIPALFGERVGKPVVGALLAAAFLAVPVILESAALFIPSLVAATIGYFLITAQDYREWRVFTLYFAYLGTAALLLLL